MNIHLLKRLSTGTSSFCHHLENKLSDTMMWSEMIFKAMNLVEPLIAL